MTYKTDDPQEAIIQAKVNYIYQRHGRQPPFGQFCGPRLQGNGYRGGKPRGGIHPNTPHPFTPRHSNTTMANKAYTFVMGLPKGTQFFYFWVCTQE